MKILMVTPYLPYPPASGGQVRSFNLIKNLGKKHHIDLVSLIKNDSEKKFIKKLKPFCHRVYYCYRSEKPWTIKNIITSIFGPFPFLIVRNSSEGAEKTLKEILMTEAYDLIHAETFYIMPNIPETKIPILLAEQTIEYQVYQHFVNNLPFILRPLFFFDIFKLKHWEKYYWKKANLIIAVSKSDKEKMLRLDSDLKIEIIPNGAGEDLINIFQEKKIFDQPKILYQGNFSWLQNTEAANILAKQIFPKIKEGLPNSLCYIAGQKAKEKIGHLKKFGVEIIDISPDETKTVKKLYQEANLFLAPIFGPGGTRLKILGAMAAGIPVISSSIGIEGLEVENKKNVMIANNEKEFINCIKLLIMNKELYHSIRVNARQLVLEKYYWPTIAKNLEKIYFKMKKNENRH